MLDNVVFVSAATTVGGRRGQTRAASGRIDLKLDSPKELGGQGSGSNPEELFACGYSACFGGMVEFLARQKKLPAAQSEVTARVSFGNDKKGGYGIAVDLEVKLPGVPTSEAQALLIEAHKHCPYSKAIAGNIDVNIRLAE